MAAPGLGSDRVSENFRIARKRNFDSNHNFDWNRAIRLFGAAFRQFTSAKSEEYSFFTSSNDL